MNKPNIVYIMADDMGYGDLGCYGATKIETPNMDRVAAEGIRFTDAHSSSSVCTPSRYSVLTGRYCWRTVRKRGVGGGFSLPLIEPPRMTLASLLKGQGYQTAAVGKWHVGLEWQLKDELADALKKQEEWRLGHRLGTATDSAGKTFDSEVWEDPGVIDYSKPILGGPRTLGFDYFFGIAGSLDMPPYCFIENERTVGIPNVEKSPYNPQQKKGYMTPGWKDEEVDLRFTEKALEVVETARRDHPDRPFFLYLAPSAPHRPCLAPDFLKGTSRAGARGDMVRVVDWMVGQILDVLDRFDLAEDTLLIVTSDNGARPADVDGNTHGHKSCGDLRGYKADIWDGGHREPFIVRWPNRIKPGSVSDETICLTDLMATFAAITGAELPQHAAEDSCSFVPALLGQSSQRSEREAIVHHSVDGMFSIRQGKWKLILGRGSGGFSEPARIIPAPGKPQGQLYDMDNDTAETTNLWYLHPQVVAQLTELLVRCKEQGYS